MFKKGSFVSFQILIALLVVSVVVGYSEGQITFSRGWTPGKRGSLDEDLVERRVTMKTATHLCRLLINQIQRLPDCMQQHAEDNDNTAIPMYP